MRERLFKNKKELISSVIAVGAKVLDVGFWGQGVTHQSEDWVHRLILRRTSDVYGIDLQFDSEHLPGPAERYFKSSAETFVLPVTFDVIFAGDLIEHLSNPGLFLDSCRQHLSKNGMLILTTPNTFDIFNIAGKLTHQEPVVNRDHTFYFNSKVLARLLEKNNWRVEELSYLYTLGDLHKESLRKKLLNVIYWICSKFTYKFIETLVVVAVPSSQQKHES